VAFVFVNNVNTTLADPITTSTQTTITLTSSAGLPTLSAGQILALTLNDAATQSQYEIVYVTDISGATLTVERGQEGTTATTWLAGDFAFCAVTAGELSDFATSGGIESITAGAGIEVTSGENPTISNTGILAISVGAGLSDSGGQSPTLQNTGVLSVTAGAGLSSSGGAQTPTLSVAGGTAGQPGSFAFNAGIVPMTLRYNYTSVITTCLTAGDGNPSTAPYITLAGSCRLDSGVDYTTGSGMTNQGDISVKVTPGAGAQTLSGVFFTGATMRVFLDGTLEVGPVTQTPGYDFSVTIPDDGAKHIVSFHVTLPSGSGTFFAAQVSAWLPQDATGAIDQTKIAYAGI
jgi:hypothetical protein